MALSRALPSGNPATHDAAAFGSDCAHAETTELAAWFCPWPAGRLATKLAASSGEFCARLEARPDINELRPSPSGKRPPHSSATFESLATNELAMLPRNWFCWLPAGSVWAKAIAHCGPRLLKAFCFARPSGN